ncbi:MAG TPA: hypothetical protein VF855_12075 [Acidimicrobiales bacterium]
MLIQPVTTAIQPPVHHTWRRLGVIAICALIATGAFLVAAQVMGNDTSARPVPAGQQLDALADYARANGLSGLSPAGMSPVQARPGTEYASQTEWADQLRSQGLAGTPSARPYADLAEIAAYARAHGLSGLSPASLG